MGNIGSSGANSRRRNSRRHNHNHNHHHHSPTPPPIPPPLPLPPLQTAEVTANRYVFAAATPYPNPNPPPSPPYYHQQYQTSGGGYYPPPPPSMPVPLPVPYDHHHHHHQRYPYGPHHHHMMGAPPLVVQPFVEHQKAVTIRNDVNLKKESLKLEADEENHGSFLVSFKFDATVSGSITIIFFAKEGEDCNLTPAKDDLKPVTVNFQQGLGQKFRQPVGTGIDFTLFEDAELRKEGDMDVYPLAVKAEAFPAVHDATDKNSSDGVTNAQITQAVFEKEKGEYMVRVAKQILWVNGMRYELQEIYGIGNSVDGDADATDPGKECVICLSEPRDTTVLPCRHMCMCSGCAKVLRFQTDRCPICRQLVERLLEIKVSNGPEE